MSLLSVLENFMVNKKNFYMIEKDNKKLTYRRRWRELEEITFKEIFDGECLEVTVPIGKVQYYSRLKKNKITEDELIKFIDNKLD
jgi:hypothetical protein